MLDTVSYKSEYKEMLYVLCLHLGSIFFFIPKLNVFSKNLHSKNAHLILLNNFYPMTFSFPVTNSKEQNLQHNYAQ